MSISMPQSTFAIPFQDWLGGGINYDIQTSQAGYQFDNNTGFEDLDQWTSLFAFLNKINPDWTETYPLSGLQLPQFFDSEVQVNTFGVVFLELDLFSPPNPIDTWYQSADFANYGVINWIGNTGVAHANPHWIQRPQYIIRAGFSDNGGFILTPKPGVTGNYTYATGWTGLPQAFVDLGSGFVPLPSLLTQIGYNNFQ